MSLRERIREKRKAIGVRQAALAHSLGMSGSYLCRIEKGERTPSLEYIPALASFLETTVDEMVKTVVEEYYSQKVLKS